MNFLIVLIDTAAGAVMYHICFPSMFAGLRRSNDVESLDNSRALNPDGGTYMLDAAVFADFGGGITDLLRIC